MTKEKEITAEVEISKVVEKIWKPLLSLLALGIVGFGVYLGFAEWTERQERLAQEELFSLQKKIESKTDELMKANLKGDEAADSKTSKSKKVSSKNAKSEIEKTPESLAKNFSDLIAEYEGFIANQSGKKASYMAAIQLAGLAESYKDRERAERALRLVVDKISAKDLFFGLVRAQLGGILMDMKKYSEAAEQFQKITEAKAQSYFHPHALLRLGACYAEGGEFDKARDVFTQLERDYPSTQAANQAKGLKKLMTLKKGA